MCVRVFSLSPHSHVPGSRRDTVCLCRYVRAAGTIFHTRRNGHVPLSVTKLSARAHTEHATQNTISQFGGSQGPNPKPPMFPAWPAFRQSGRNIAVVGIHRLSITYFEKQSSICNGPCLPCARFSRNMALLSGGVRVVRFRVGLYQPGRPLAPFGSTWHSRLFHPSLV